MDPLEKIEAIARIARTEVTPETNVRIMPLLRAARAKPRWQLAPLAWSAAISAVAACVILTVALHQDQSTSSSVDSISPLFTATQVQLP